MRAVVHFWERNHSSNSTKTLEELERSQKNNLFLLPAARHATISRDQPEKNIRAFVSRCACMACTHTPRPRRRARAKTARVVLPSNPPPHVCTCPHSACPCTRNGALLPSPPTAFARMHVPAHMTTPYTRIFSSQWLWNRAFSPLLSLSSPTFSSSVELRTHSNYYVSPSRLWNSVRFLGHADRHGIEPERGTSIPSVGNHRAATNSILSYIRCWPPFSIVKERLDFLLITNNIRDWKTEIKSLLSRRLDDPRGIVQSSIHQLTDSLDVVFC